MLGAERASGCVFGCWCKGDHTSLDRCLLGRLCTFAIFPCKQIVLHSIRTGPCLAKRVCFVEQYQAFVCLKQSLQMGIKLAHGVE